ncbi:MAG: hypothetical protein WAM85_00895 [Terracidiphilus sp.]
MKAAEQKEGIATAPAAWGLAVRLLERLRRHPPVQPRLVLLERVTLAPRQSLALFEADGQRLLVATSAEGAPAFYALDNCDLPILPIHRKSWGKPAGRVSW